MAKEVVQIQQAVTSNEADDGLLYWMLSLTPSQRLDVLAEYVTLAEELRRGRPTAKPI